MSRVARELFAPDLRLFSFMAYKLGEMSANNGRREEAIGALRAAVEANPPLVEMVRKEFGTLYEG